MWKAKQNANHVVLYGYYIDSLCNLKIILWFQIHFPYILIFCNCILVGPQSINVSRSRTNRTPFFRYISHPIHYTSH